MEKFLELRCPGLPKNKALNCNGHEECRRELAGPSIDTINACLKVGPYVDIRYCNCCRVMWKITISNVGMIPQYEMMAKDVEIPFIRDADYFDLIAVDSLATEKVK